MMGAVATVLALIFSVALLVLSMVSTLFGPRLLYRFLQDWVTQGTIGMFMGTFVYICLVFLVTHQDPRSSFIPQISLITAWMLVVLSFGFLVYYSHRVAKSIQNPDMIGAIVDDLYVAAGRAHVPGPGEGTGAVPDDATILRQAETGATVSCAKRRIFAACRSQSTGRRRARGGRTNCAQVPPGPIRTSWRAARSNRSAGQGRRPRSRD